MTEKGTKPEEIKIEQVSRLWHVLQPNLRSDITSLLPTIDCVVT